MVSINSPCYDLNTKTDCPKRKVGCRTDCEKWTEYESMKNKIYQMRSKEFAEKDFFRSVKNKLDKIRLKHNY